MNDTLRSPGKTTIAIDVLKTITEMTTLGVEGVSRLAVPSNRPYRIFKRKGLLGPARISLQGSAVNIDIDVILKEDINIRQVSREIQKNVARSITEMVGMDIGEINIHIEDIDHENDN